MNKPTFRADLHIHSRFSRATSTKLNAPLLAGWAALKGLAVIGTGDFTHPAWLAELEEMLQQDEHSGLYRLKDATAVALNLPEWEDVALLDQSSNVRFMLQCEISSIYKRAGKVRKVHNLVFMPNLEAAKKFATRMGEIGNISSDGRPILGLDSENLLELVLNTHPEAFLIPAHIWTPWFSVFGSKSGFDSIEECFGSLAEHIFALETGLSSDPEMNRMVSSLDRFRLISNSDAHSGENLAREANIFSGEISYSGIFNALRARENIDDLPTKFLGTMEFFPDEGKYHLDGHRDCKISLHPEETRTLAGICPVCGKPVTVGVLYRVKELADRAEPEYQYTETFDSLIPLPEILGEILSVGPKSRKVNNFYRQVLSTLGSELDVLSKVPLGDIATVSQPLAEGISRMRKGKVIRYGGYDGEFGVIHVFQPEEIAEFKFGGKLAGVPAARRMSLLPESATSKTKQTKAVRKAAPVASDTSATLCVAAEQEKKDNSPDSLPTSLNSLNKAQSMAIQAGPGPVLVLAGPGTGKTHTLIARVKHLLDQGIAADKILAVTFTRRAARELSERLAHTVGPENTSSLPRADTLHALAFEFWSKVQAESPVLLNEEAALRVFAESNSDEPAAQRKAAWHSINLCRERREQLPEKFQPFFERYTQHKTAWNLADYTDLLEFWLTQALSGLYPVEWKELLVDEIQDLSPLQLDLVAALSQADGKGFFGIGDPEQSIYGFRGAHGRVLEYFKQLWPSLKQIQLKENYRSGELILKAAGQQFESSDREELEAKSEYPGEIYLFEANSAESEATWVAGQIRYFIGSTSHSLLAAEEREGSILKGASYSPGDFAILLRTRALMLPIRRALERAGIPFSQPSADPFWHESRVIKIMEVAGRMLGISPAIDEQQTKRRTVNLECPDRVLIRGPLSLAAYWGASEPFDAQFWQSSAFKALNRAFEEHGGWEELLNWINLQNELELVRQKSEQVQLLTIHAAKGSEFRMVFMPALEDGLLPFAGNEFLSGQPATEQIDLDEERRLFYVGLTRAKEGLFISHAAKRHIYNRELRLKASRFLVRLPLADSKHSVMVAKKTSREEQMKLF